MKPRISVIIPVVNEEGSVKKVYEDVRAVLTRMNQSFEIIFVNDGSTDTTQKVLESLHDCIVIEFGRNYGQSTALAAGFRHAQGEIFVSLDGDGQNDPEDIPKLLEVLTDPDIDVVAGWRQERNDSSVIKFITRAARVLRARIVGDHIHDSGCTLRAYRRSAVESVELHGEMHRYFLALLAWRGFHITEIPVTHHARVTGESKYGWGKAIRGFIDLVYIWFLYRYSQRPLHLFGYFGLITFALGVGSLFFTLYDRILLGIHLNRDGWFFLTFFFFLTTIIFMSFGLVIDLLMRIYYNSSPHEDRYTIRSVKRISTNSDRE